MFLALAALLLQSPQVPEFLGDEPGQTQASIVQCDSQAEPCPVTQASSKTPPEASSRLNLRGAEPFLNRPSFRTGNDLPKLFGVAEQSAAPTSAFLAGQIEPAAVTLAADSEKTPSVNAPSASPRTVTVSPAPLPFRVGVESKNSRRLWYGLVVAQHSAATFDAWSTRRVIASGSGRELNPLLRPFAGSNALYGAVQIGPGLLDYVGKRMMTSQHAWMRRVWWVPQVAGTAASLVSGTHNLGVYRQPAPGFAP